MLCLGEKHIFALEILAFPREPLAFASSQGFPSMWQTRLSTLVLEAREAREVREEALGRRKRLPVLDVKT